MMYDPPSGWKYGFPRPYLPKKGETLLETLIRDGYPLEEAKKYDGDVRCRFFPSTLENERDREEEHPNTCRCEVCRFWS